MCVCARACMVRMCSCVHVCVCACMVHMCTCACMRAWFICAHVCARVYVRACVRAHVCVCFFSPAVLYVKYLCNVLNRVHFVFVISQNITDHQCFWQTVDGYVELM